MAADALMKSTAIGHLEQMQQDAQQAAEKHGSMQDAVERYLAGIPRRGSFGKTPRITEIQSRMLRHLLIRERYLEERRHALGLDYDLASMGFTLDRIFDRMVVPQGRKFADLAAGDEDAFPEMAVLDTTPRTSRYAETEQEEARQAADN